MLANTLFYQRDCYSSTLRLMKGLEGNLADGLR
jgi:hypothetical protein